MKISKYNIKPDQLKTEFKKAQESDPDLTIATFAQGKVSQISTKVHDNYKNNTHDNLGTLLPMAGFVVTFIAMIVLAYKFNLATTVGGKWGEAFGAGILGAGLAAIPYAVVRGLQRSQIPDNDQKNKLAEAVIKALEEKKAPIKKPIVLKVQIDLIDLLRRVAPFNPGGFFTWLV